MATMRLGVLLVALTAVPALAAPQTWTGTISDSMCGAKHMDGEHGMKVSDKACTEMCVKKGASYVFVSDGKVLTIANPQFKGLAQQAGAVVKLSGERKGDTVTVSKLEKAAPPSN
jgi:hypothetical protein